MEWFWEREVAASSETSAIARFLVFLLWAVKIEGLDLEGRARAVVQGWEADWARREVSSEVKDKVVEEDISLARVFGRGMP